MRLRERAGTLSPDGVAAVRAWLAAYLDWLLTGRQGLAERRARNNHGTCYDLQVGAVATDPDSPAVQLLLQRMTQLARADVPDMQGASGNAGGGDHATGPY